MKRPPAKNRKGATADVANAGIVLEPDVFRPLAVAIADELEARALALAPALARIAGADIVHSPEHPETVLRRAIDEGDIVRGLLVERMKRGKG